jgi:hypothetical protein
MDGSPFQVYVALRTDQNARSRLEVNRAQALEVVVKALDPIQAVRLEGLKLEKADQKMKLATDGLAGLAHLRELGLPEHVLRAFLPSLDLVLAIGKGIASLAARKAAISDPVHEETGLGKVRAAKEVGKVMAVKDGKVRAVRLFAKLEAIAQAFPTGGSDWKGPGGGGSSMSCPFVANGILLKQLAKALLRSLVKKGIQRTREAPLRPLLLLRAHQEAPELL